MRPNSLVLLGAAATAVFLARAPIVRAQREGTMAMSAQLLTAPSGRALAVVRKGATVTVGPVRGGFTQVTLDGWVATALLAGARDSFRITIKGDDARLRTTSDAKASIVAEMAEGMGLAEVATRGTWTRVRRTGWVPTRTVVITSAPAASHGAPAAAAPAAPAADASPEPPPGPPPVGALTPARHAMIYIAPDARAIAAVDSGAWLEPVARERGWVQVRVEGWVKESDLIPADTTLGVVSAADLRADPQGTRGRLVHWNVEVYGLQTADPLRKDFAEDEPYLLARGPEGEDALLYLAVPPSLLNAARGLPALARVTITARVRTGRSDPTGVPILDLLTLTRR